MTGIDTKAALDWKFTGETSFRNNYSLISPFHKYCLAFIEANRVAEVAREHRWHPPKSLDSDEKF